ncbi:MAG TPA: cell wall-binding repeat-containing protein [Egibacteraceae bacterium]|nr:cell wall-binding repeat-containing protein [Egibacteraceae bacterium]
MRHRFALLVVSAALASAGLLAPAADSIAAGPLDSGGVPVFPGLRHHRLVTQVNGGAPAVSNVLSFDASDPSLELRPVLARDTIPGVETVPAMGSRVLGSGGVAGINGGFWLASPFGEPNGYIAIDGQLESESQTQGEGPRGTAGILPDGSLIMDRLDSAIQLFTGLANVGPYDVSGINRYCCGTQPAPDKASAIYLYSAAFGPITIEPLSEDAAVRSFIVGDLKIPAVGGDTGTVQVAYDGARTLSAPLGSTVVVAHGSRADSLAGIAAGDTLRVEVELLPSETASGKWDGLVAGLAAGPLVVRDGQMTDPANWESEGFAANVHSDVRHPRSAIAQTADGKILLVTVDGRQPGYSAGMTLSELASYLISLGARDALSLDGGGSSQFVVDGLLRNEPCCDSSLRSVADGLFVFHNYTFTRASRLSGASRFGTAAEIAVSAYPGGASRVVLAAGGDFPDALAGGPLAARLGAPLLLSGGDFIPAETAAALKQLGAQSITVLGGSAAIDDKVVAALEKQGYKVRRLAGRDRLETAARIAAELAPTHARAVLAAAGNFPDALSSAAPAGMLGMPILLTGPSDLGEATRAALVASKTKEVVIVGGKAVIGAQVESQLAALGINVTRLAGQNRFATAKIINEWAAQQLPELDPSGLVVARGGGFPDALAGGPLAASRKQLLMIAPDHDINADKAAADYFAARAPKLDSATLLGGHAVLTSHQHWQLDQLAQ